MLYLLIFFLVNYLHSTDVKTVVFVFSYHEEYGTVSMGGEGAVFGLVQEGYLEDINLKIIRRYMHTKTINTETHEKVAIANEILSEINSIEYDVLATFDDNAFKYVGLNITDGHPIVFTGMNALPEFYNETEVHFLNSREKPGHNITGVYEKIFVVEALQVMSLVIPELTDGGVIMMIADSTTSGQMITIQVQSELTLAPEGSVARNVTFEYYTVSHFEEYKELVLETLNKEERFHAMYYSALSLEVGDGSLSVSTQEICAWTAENSNKPELVPGRPYCEEGLMAGLGPDYFDMGSELGLRVGKILSGEFVGDIPIGVPRHSIYVNKDRTNHLGITVREDFEGFCSDVFYTPPVDAGFEISTPESWDPTWLIAVVSSLLGIFFLLIVCSICCCCTFVCCLCYLLCCFGVFGNTCICYFCVNWCVLRQKQRKFNVIGKHDLDRIVVEMKEAKRKSIPHIQICKQLFQVPYKDLKLLGVVGKGGQDCIVYKVKWKSKIVAYKSFRSTAFTEEDVHYDAFEKEISILASVFHPNLLGFYGCCMEKGRVGILMEYCENGDLQGYLLEQKLLELDINIDERIMMLKEIADGMQYLHEKDIIHRDLKGKNVLLTDTKIVKIIDFGLSRMNMSNDAAKTKRIGTSYYMAPEIVCGNDYGQEVDIFSFGIMMFEVLTSDFNPFKQAGNEMFGIELRIANDPKFRPVIDKSLYPGEFSWFFCLMESCWQHDRKFRPDFGAIVREFERNTNGGKKKIRKSMRFTSSRNGDNDLSIPMINNETTIIIDENIDDGKYISSEHSLNEDNGEGENNQIETFESFKKDFKSRSMNASSLDSLLKSNGDGLFG